MREEATIRSSDEVTGQERLCPLLVLAKSSHMQDFAVKPPSVGRKSGNPLHLLCTAHKAAEIALRVLLRN